MRIFLALLVVSLSLVPAAQSRVFPCTAGDTGCILAAIAHSNLQPARQDVIELDGSTFTFTRQDNGNDVDGFTATPVILGNLTIRGVDASQTILARDAALDTPLFRLLHIGPSGRVTLEGLTIQGGAVSPVFFNRGGGIFNEGDLLLQDAAIAENEAWIGGGIHNGLTGTLRLLRCAITGNTADFVAGGVTSLGPTFIDGCLIADNLAESGGGLGFDPNAGKIIVRNSIIAGNVAFFIAGGGAEGVGELDVVNTVFLDNGSGLRGGAISLDNGHLTLRQVAMVGNQAANFGGGIYVTQGTVDIRRSLLANNRVVFGGAGGGIFNVQGDVTLRNSVLAGNTAPVGPDCAGTVQVAGRTLVGDPTGCDVQQ
jgi:predicted outer membrane repeat protein